MALDTVRERSAPICRADHLAGRAYVVEADVSVRPNVEHELDVAVDVRELADVMGGPQPGGHRSEPHVRVWVAGEEAGDEACVAHGDDPPGSPCGEVRVRVAEVDKALPGYGMSYGSLSTSIQFARKT